MSTPTLPVRTASHSSWRLILSWVSVALTPVVLTLAFVVGMALVGDPNEPTAPSGWDAAWRVVLLWLIVIAVPVAGAVLGWLARVRGEPTAGTAAVVNGLIVAFFTVVTLGGGLADAFG